MKKVLKGLNLFELLYLIFGTLIVVVCFIFTPEKNWLVLVTAVLGVVAFFSVAKGYFIAPILNIIYSGLYIVMALTQKYYGEIVLSCLCILLNIFAIVSWFKNRNKEDKNIVQVNDLKWQEYVAVIVSAALLTVGFYYILRAIGTAQALTGAISMILSLSAEYLALRRSNWYALGYILNDVTVMVLWCFTLSGSGLEFLPTILSFGVYFVNDVYGLINWNLLKHKQARAANTISQEIGKSSNQTKI